MCMHAVRDQRGDMVKPLLTFPSFGKRRLQAA